MIEERDDVLTYTSAVLASPLTILGEIILELYAATNCEDTDWIATLIEVFPDGRSIPFYWTVGALRARYRNGFDKSALLTSDEPVKYTISLGVAGHQIPADHRIRLSLCSASFPHLDANTNTGNPAATDTELVVAKQTIYHSKLMPSHLRIPILTVTK